jgi:energy-coupling factor transporter ATP-binding protein EcfA2
MRIRRLRVTSYKSLRDCDIAFIDESPFTAIIGNNGSGKSNLIEAILHILIDLYFGKPTKSDFESDFEFDFVAKTKEVTFRRAAGSVSVKIDGVQMPAHRFADLLQSGSQEVAFPERTFVYYSGECPRIRRLIGRYSRHFQNLAKADESDHLSPLFVQSTNEQAQIILLALFAHGHSDFLETLGIESVEDVTLDLQSPESFDPTRDEPKLWGTTGLVRTIVAAIDEVAAWPKSRRRAKDVQGRSEEAPFYVETRTYTFGPFPAGRNSIRDLAARLEKGGDNLYLALEHLKARGIFRGASFKIRRRGCKVAFAFENLSEGEKQLLAVIGGIRLTNQQDSLILLDEPDTHLNPKWSWEYWEMLDAAFRDMNPAPQAILLTTHNPVMISGLTREQVLLAPGFARPRRDPKGQGIANLLCSSEFFGLPSSLDKESQKLLEERLRLTVKPALDGSDRKRLLKLNQLLEMVLPGVSERDPKYVRYLRKTLHSKHGGE